MGGSSTKIELKTAESTISKPTARSRPPRPAATQNEFLSSHSSEKKTAESTIPKPVASTSTQRSAVTEEVETAETTTSKPTARSRTPRPAATQGEIIPLSSSDSNQDDSLTRPKDGDSSSEDIQTVLDDSLTRPKDGDSSSGDIQTVLDSNLDDSLTRTKDGDSSSEDIQTVLDEAEESKTEDTTFEKTVIQHPKRNALMVAGIDFGTTYSSFAFSFRDNPMHIETPITREKTPTVLLLKPDQAIHSFGLEAEQNYEKLSVEDQQEWYLFERFKMQIYCKDRQLLAMDMKLKDFTGKELPAIDVFTKAIISLKSYLMKIVEKKNAGIRPDSEIHWVLTVPTIWDDLAKHFMREAAKMSGIPDEMLTIALEPEAASVWCLKKFGVTDLPIGCKFTLLDIGGGTGDITIHERQPGGRLKELLPPVGGAFGGNEVNKKFLDHLTSMFGNVVIQTFKAEHSSEYRELIGEIERKKKSFDGSAGIKLTLPLQLRELYEDDVGEAFEELLQNSIFKKKVVKKNDKLDLSADLVLGFFSEVTDEIVKKLESVEEKVETKYIILAGGFSSSPYIQKEISNRFGNKLKIPDDPEMVVVKGAVLYGHSPDKIASRKVKYTYGIARMMKFKPYHKLEKKVTVDGVDYVDDVFNKHIEIGEEVKIEDAEKAKAQEYFPPGPHVTQVILEVYASDKKNPVYVTDAGCFVVGLIKLDIDPKGDLYSKILVKMIFGGTELVIEATDVKNNTVIRQSIDFWG